MRGWWCCYLGVSIGDSISFSRLSPIHTGVANLSRDADIDARTGLQGSGVYRVPRQSRKNITLDQYLEPPVPSEPTLVTKCGVKTEATNNQSPPTPPHNPDSRWTTSHPPWKTCGSSIASSYQTSTPRRSSTKPCSPVQHPLKQSLIRMAGSCGGCFGCPHLSVAQIIGPEWKSG